MIAHFARVLIIILFSAIALFELNIAREIVLIGFAVIFLTLGAIAVILTFIRGRERIRKNPPSQKDDG
jgi:hypothetical protein